MLMSKYTILIQGPLNSISIRNMVNYQKFGNVVISCYNNDNFEIFKEAPNTNYRLISRKPPSIENLIGLEKKDSYDTFYWSLLSTYAGILISDTKYIIKTRSDDSFSDLSVMINAFEKNIDKLVCGNMFAAPAHLYFYHIGDHTFIAKKEYLLKMYKNLIDMYHGNIPIENWARYGYNVYNSFESILGKSFLNAKGIDFNVDKHRSIFENNFEVIDLNKCGNFICSQNHLGKKLWENNFVNPFGVVDNRTVWENNYHNPAAGFPYKVVE